MQFPHKESLKKLIKVRQSNREDEYGEVIHMKMRKKKEKWEEENLLKKKEYRGTSYNISRWTCWRDA